MTLKSEYPCFLANKSVKTNDTMIVTDKFTGLEATKVSKANQDMLEKAILAAVNAEDAMSALPAFQRKAILQHCAKRFKEREEELALALCIEAGKPINDSKAEVTRLIDTFEIAAEESIRITGEVLPLDISPRAKGYRGFWKRVPKGACLFITPFNFPLNLVAHKLAPAIAAGCPFILKPASLTPVGALIIGEILAETDLPPGAFSILPCDNELAEKLVSDDRLKYFSFTGSAKVGWMLKEKAKKKSVTLELGGNAACVIDKTADAIPFDSNPADTNSADANSADEISSIAIDSIIKRIIIGAFYQSGQSCISVQRLFIHKSLYDEVKDKLVKATKELKCGDPKNPEYFIGPMISEKEASRLTTWIDESVKNGAKLLCGGERTGNIGTMITPALLEHVNMSDNLYKEEAFGPVALLYSFEEFDKVLTMVNDSRYGLQAGIFTNDLNHMFKAWDTLKVGGVIINDIPSWRIDHMPYGGTKDSGVGREGLRFAIEEMTEIRLLAIRG